MPHQQAPECPSWCTYHQSSSAGRWDDPVEMTKTCEREVTICDGCKVRLDQFFHIDGGGQLVTEPAHVALDCADYVNLTAAGQLADMITRLVSLANRGTAAA